MRDKGKGLCERCENFYEELKYFHIVVDVKIGEAHARKEWQGKTCKECRHLLLTSGFSV